MLTMAIGEKARTGIWILAVATLTCGLFAPALEFGFAGLDDSPFVEANPMVRKGLSAETIRWAWTTTHMGYWAPLLWMSFQADAQFWGPEPQGFHRTSVLLHALNAGLLFWLLRRWSGSSGLAAALALLWAAHPLRVESVAWIAERKGVLSGLFFLLCLAFYTGGGAGKGWKHAAGVVCLTMGMWVKPGALIPAPFVLLALDVWPLRRCDWSMACALRLVREKWAYWFSAFGFGFVAWSITRSLVSLRTDMPSLWVRMLLIPGNYLTYARQTAWPKDLSVFYPTPLLHPARLVGAVAGLSAGLALAWWLRRRRPEILVGALWTLGMLAPSIGLFWTGTTEGLGDRFSYLSAMGVCVMGVGVWALLADRRWRWAAIGVAMAGIVALAWAARLQLSHWRTAELVLRRAVHVAPQNLIARVGHGYALSQSKQWTAALAEYERIFDSGHPMRFQAIVPLANCWLQLGHPERAIEILEGPAALNPSIQVGRHLYLGQALLDAGRAGEAVPHLKAVLQRHPELTEVWPDFFSASFEADQEAESIRWAMELIPPDGNRLGRAKDLMPFYVKKWHGGEKHRALAYFKRVIARSADDPLPLNNLAWLLAVDAEQTADPQLALDCAVSAMASSGGEIPGVWDTLSVARANAGNFGSAIEAAEHARRLARAAGDARLAAALAARIARYRQGEPWRETDAQTAAPRPPVAGGLRDF